MGSLKKGFGRCQIFKDWKPGYKKYRKKRRETYFGQDSILKMLFDMRINGAFAEFLKRDQDYQKLIAEAADRKKR